MPGFKLLRASDVPGSTALARIRDLLTLDPDHVSQAADLAATQAPAFVFGAVELGAIAEGLGLPPEQGLNALQAILYLANCLDRQGATECDLVHDLRLAGLSEAEAESLTAVLEKLRPRVPDLGYRVREVHAAHEVLPIISDFEATCDLRAVFQTPISAEDVLAADAGPGIEDEEDVVAWVPIAILTLETRDLTGERKATTFQVPLAILGNLATTLEKVRSRLERTIRGSGGSGLSR